MNYYTFQPVKIHRQILTNIIPTQMGKTVVIVDNTANKIRGKFGLWSVKGWINGLVHDCWVTAKIRSLPEVKLPLFEEFDTATDRLQKTLLYEWGTARLELEILLGDSLGNWGSFGESAIKNSNGYRYRKHRTLDLMTDNPGFQLEEGFKVGVRLINVGFGDLTAADKIDVMGAWTQEFVAVQQQPPYVVNNVYGSATTPTPTPTSIAVLTLNLASGTSALIASGTPIAVNLTKATANKTYTATWRKDGTATVLTSTFTTNANGDATLSFDSSAFATLGNGKYGLELTDNTIKVISNEINAVLPTLSISPSTAYNSSLSTITVSVTGIAINDTYTLQFPGVSNTSATRTQTAETTSFNFSGSLFASVGTYKARLTKGNVTVDSTDLVITASPTVLISTPQGNVGFLAEDTLITYRASNLQKSTPFTFAWLKNNVQVVSAQSSTDANGEWLGSFNASVMATSPYGEGLYKLKITQGTVEIISNQFEIRVLKFGNQAVQGATYYSGNTIVFEVVGIPPGASFTYSIFKTGVLQGTPVNQTFTYAANSINNMFHNISLSASTLINAYGTGSNYMVRISYNGKTLDSNTFILNAQAPSTAGGFG